MTTLQDYLETALSLPELSLSLPALSLPELSLPFLGVSTATYSLYPRPFQLREKPVSVKLRRTQHTNLSNIFQL